MRSLQISVLFSSALLLAACAHVGASNGPFQPTGSVDSRNGSASFDQSEVRGPSVHMTRRADGSWAGELGGRALDISMKGQRFVGANFSMKIQPRQPGRLTIAGQYRGRLFRFELTPNHLGIRTAGSGSADLVSSGGSGQYESSPGTPSGYQAVTFTGQAKAPNPPEPQFALALLSAVLS